MALQTLFVACLFAAIAVAIASDSRSKVGDVAEIDAAERTVIIDHFESFKGFNARRRRFRRFRRKCGKHANRFRNYDGSCNNKRRIKLGSADSTFYLKVRRRGTTPSGRGRPNPRKISNEICDDPHPKKNRRRMSELTTFFGQFLDHTISETENEKTEFPITIPSGDPVFKGGHITFFRTRKEKTRRGYSPVNLLTSYIDAASVYGAHQATSDKLRAFKKGLLKEGAPGMPIKNARGFFLSGDKRVNENPALISMHVLFMREHNRLCREIGRAFPYWGDEKVYQVARKIVSAEMQSVVYYEFIPTVLGRRIPWRRYKPWVNPSVSDEFSTAAYRVGHTLINPDMTFVTANGRRQTRKLRSVFFQPKTLDTFSVEDILRGVVKTRCAEVDVHITSEVRNFLQGNPNSQLRLDLAALNIQRGRDHQTPSYNRMRIAYGLRPARYFSDITRNRVLARKLKRTYRSPGLVDAWVGGLAENHVRGSSLGPLFHRMWIQEFRRLRDGDRFYFEKFGSFRNNAQRKIPTLRRLLQGRYRGSMMRNLILWNTSIKPSQLPRNIWKVQARRTQRRRYRPRRRYGSLHGSKPVHRRRSHTTVWW